MNTALINFIKRILGQYNATPDEWEHFNLLKGDCAPAPMKLQIEWVRQMGKYDNGWNAISGKFKIGSVSWNGGDEPYKATCELPGIQSSIGTFTTSEDAKARVEYVANYWLGKVKVTV